MGTGPANGLAAVIISSLPTSGTLTNERQPGHRGAEHQQGRAGPGLVRFRRAANANGPGLPRLTFKVQDNGGTANGGVDIDLAAHDADVQRHGGQRSRSSARTTRSSAPENGTYTFATTEFANQRSARHARPTA